MEILDSIEHYYRDLGFSCVQATGQKWLEMKIRLRHSDRKTVLLVCFYNQPTTLTVVTTKYLHADKGKDFDLNDPKSLQTLHQLIVTHLCSTPSQPTTKTKATS